MLLIFVVAALAAGAATRFPRFWPEIVAAAVAAAGGILVFSHENPLGFFLRFVNPVLALVVLAICVYAASTDVDNGKLVYQGCFQGGIPSYFLAKGIFCSAALFLLGKLLEVMILRDRKY